MTPGVAADLVHVAVVLLLAVLLSVRTRQWLHAARALARLEATIPDLSRTAYEAGLRAGRARCLTERHARPSVPFPRTHTTSPN